MCPKKNNNDNINENTNQKNTSYQGDDFLKEYNNAIFRAAHYEGNIENIIRDKVALILSSDSTPLKNKVIKHVVDKISEANQVFEFNHLGNLLMKSPAIKYIAMSFLRRILIKLSIAQKIDPTLKITKSSQDAGIGFLEGWSTEDKQWASQLNDLLKEGINPRVLTTLAYQYMKVFRDHTLLSSMGDEINIDLLKAKENNPRFDIFHRHEDNSTPVFSLPITTQPHGWPWLKYADWNSGNLIFKDKKSDFIAERITGDPHKGTGYNFQGMNNAIYPPLYKSNDFSLKEREKHESGYGGFIINDQSLHSYNNVTDISVNWRRQNSEKALPMLAGPSSTTSFMYEISRLLNMPANEVELFRLLLLSWMIQGRDHSFTEIMGALDAYAMEYEEKGPTSINIDEKMAWQARKTGEWHRSYENLISDDIMLPGLKSETIELNGQQIHLPALEEVKIEKINFESFLSDGKGFPSQYASDEYIISAAEYYKKNMEPEDEHGLANESILYAPQNNDNLKLYNYIPRQTPKRPEIEKPTQPYIDSDREIKLKNWLANLSQTKKMDLFNSSVFLLAESSQINSITNVFHHNYNNAIWEIISAKSNTRMLSESMSIKGIKPGETPLNFLLDIINEQQSESERIEAIINAIGHSEKNKDTLIISMLLAVTRFYSANGGNIINPGYGNFSPPENDDEMNMRLTKLLKQNNYHKTSDRAQAKKEYDHTHALLSEAIKSPLFDRYTGVVWHGCHISVAENMINKKENINFPGFMSTTYDPDVAMSYASKGALLVIKINEPAGSLIEGISSAPNEKELLFDKEAKFSVEASYILHLEKGYPPNCKTNMQKRIFDLKVSKGEVQPYAQVEIIPDDKSNHQTEESDEETNLQYIKQIADHIKTKVSSLDEDMRIVILQKNADDKISEYKQDVGHMDSHDISPHNILAEIFHNRIRRHTFYDLQIPAPDFNVKENHQNSNSTGYFGNQYTEELNEQSQAIPVMPERIINKPKRKLSL